MRPEAETRDLRVRRSFRRFFRITGPNVALAVVITLSCGLLFEFSGRSQRGYDRALTASHLTALVENIHTTEFEVSAGRQVADGNADIKRHLATASRLIRQLSGDDILTQRVVSEFHECVAALDVQFRYLLAGDREAAERVDHARVDPGLDRLKRALEMAAANAVTAAETASERLREVSAAVLLATVGLVAWITARRRRRDIRAAQTAERARVVAASERRFRALVDNGDDVIILTDEHAVICEVSDNVAHVLDVDPKRRMGRKITDLVHPDEITAAEAEFGRVITVGATGPSEWRCRDGAGNWRNVEVTWTNMLALPEVAAVVLNLRDVTERHRLEEELRHRAFHDSLTGLANRALLHDRINHAMAGRDTCDAALLVLDLDGFKHVNDSLGHPAGDHALAIVADRLLAVCRAKDTVARLGGDEFAILVEDPLSHDAIQALGNRLIEAVAQPFDWQNHLVVLGASVGIAYVDSNVHGADDLVRYADVGLYAAKSAGRGAVRSFDANLYDAARMRFDLESDLRTAVDNDEFFVQYQPIVELTTSRPAGFEALVRWRHPTRGVLAPDQFIPIAEETGLIVPVGRWVLNQACRDLATWTRSYPAAAGLYVSVNLSARQLEDPQLVSDVQHALVAADLDPVRLILEITETAFMHDVQAALTRFDALKALGIRLSVDDFGTGYSSLSYLRQFPIDTVKIDKSFIDNISDGRDDASFVGAILRLSEALHLDTLAEGIETGSQADALQDLGCHLGQGYHYARPLDALDIAKLLETDIAAPPASVPSAR